MIANLKSSGLLTMQGIRIKGIDQNETVISRYFLGNGGAIIIAAPDSEYMGAIDLA